jgi:hypothetical protein
LVLVSQFPIAVLGFAAAAIAFCLLWRRRKAKSDLSQGRNSDNLPEVLTQRSKPSAQYATMEKSIQVTQSPATDDFSSPSTRRNLYSVPKNSISPDPRQFTTSPSPPPDNIGVATTIGHASSSRLGDHDGDSNLPEVVVRPGDDNEIRRIQLEQARLQERKSRLVQMVQLEREEEMLERRLQSRMKQIGGHAE